MAKFRKKPVVIEAVQYGPYSMPTVELAGFLEGVHCSIGSDGLVIETLEGNMLAGVGDWIIKGVNGEFYPCKPDIFEKTYEAVEEGSESSPEQPSYKHPEKDIFNLSEDEDTKLPDSPTEEAILSPGKIINPVVDHEDNEFTGERTYIYADGTRSGPCPAPASWSPNGQAQE